jgi:hypothetical protein
MVRQLIEMLVYPLARQLLCAGALVEGATALAQD